MPGWRGRSALLHEARRPRWEASPLRVRLRVARMSPTRAGDVALIPSGTGGSVGASTGLAAAGTGSPTEPGLCAEPLRLLRGSEIVVALVTDDAQPKRCSIPRCKNTPEGTCGMCSEDTCEPHGAMPYHFSFRRYGAKKG